MPALPTFSHHVADLIRCAGSADFPASLIAMLRDMVPVDDATVIAYPGMDMPVIEYFEEPNQSGSSTLDRFVKGAFLLDPFYLTATRDNRHGVFRLRDLSPTGFRDSDYYKTWYRDSNFVDECGFIVPVGERGFVNIALGKTASRATFTKRELSTLEAIYPSVEALCQQHWTLTSSDKTGDNLRAKLHSALESFGSSLLTERETQVINLVLHGHSTKTVADKLSISMETVKLHRKHAYAKLEISSQAELFYLFLDSLMSAQDYESGDTLVAYMAPPPKRGDAR
ncbi:helix-turn-helix transcriptional regulator [Halioglobus sp. HI00S01]|uniref:response regulator transcription factor n=1 Tax=Halioglobus sp. HI00S01 TaxID=1822214 RepID=UPI0007C3016B|nr:helix-turn-helix transcriptional regulator [Halioglobus sp. HI00S01]KZX58090.1 helix-turn-helix transcriptional regulator [Halioglobus sp. HI00S01]